MCNFVHIEHRSIPEKGKAWKVFKVTEKGQLRPIQASSRIFPINEWIHWDEDEQMGAGFCGFLSEDEAMRLTENWLSERPEEILEIHPIEYDNGICEQAEESITYRSKYEVCLFKSFRINRNNRNKRR